MYTHLVKIIEKVFLLNFFGKVKYIAQFPNLQGCPRTWCPLEDTLIHPGKCPVLAVKIILKKGGLNQPPPPPLSKVRLNYMSINIIVEYICSVFFVHFCLDFCRHFDVMASRFLAEGTEPAREKVLGELV